jgi:hypothetical protein
MATFSMNRCFCASLSRAPADQQPPMLERTQISSMPLSKILQLPRGIGP